jgi:pimeloyl-ACP methyl ester carboxylesterase
VSHGGQIGVFFDSIDGNLRLLGTLFLARGDNPKPTVILLHGVPGIEKNYDLALRLRENGWNSLIFHYRGCWGSDGIYTIKTLPDDTRAAIDYLSTGQYPQIDTDNLVLIGHSMGGFAALLAAIDEPRIRAVAVLGAVTNPHTMPMTLSLAQDEYAPWLPGLSAQDFLDQWQSVDSQIIPTHQVHRIRQPLLVIHSEQDEVAPITQAHELAENAPDHARFVFHPGANHSFTWHRDWLWEQLSVFLDEL